MWRIAPRYSQVNRTANEYASRLINIRRASTRYSATGCRFMSVAMPRSADWVRHLLPDRPG